MTIDVNLFLIIISITIINGDQTIRRLPYELHGDIISLEGGNTIAFELTFIDASASKSSLIIETEQWVHDCCLEITTSPDLRIYLKQHSGNYLNVKTTAYLNLRKPLSSIILTGVAKLTTTNFLTTDTVLLQLSGSSKAKMNVTIYSDLYVTVSGTAELIIRGIVKGTGYIQVSGAGEVTASSCLMNKAIADVSGVGKVYVAREQAVHPTQRGLGRVLYGEPSRNQIRSIFSESMNRFFGVSNTASNTSSNIIIFYFIFFILFSL